MTKSIRKRASAVECRDTSPCWHAIRERFEYTKIQIVTEDVVNSFSMAFQDVLRGGWFKSTILQCIERESNEQ